MAFKPSAAATAAAAAVEIAGIIVVVVFTRLSIALPLLCNP
jgi:hypothetical protein